MRLLGIALRRPLALAGVPWTAARAAWKLKFRSEPPEFPDAPDPEIPLFELRGNWMLRALEEDGPEACAARFAAATESAKGAALGAYSRSQRIANFVYLWRSTPAEARASLLARAGEALHADAAYLAGHPEYGLNAVGFNNHLLNNYRASVLYRAHLTALPGAVDLSPFIARVGRLLLRKKAVLFGEGTVLLEGSVSYEILGAKHLVDIACADPDGPLAPFARQAAADYPARALALYRKGDRWLLPEVGDLSPDWDRAATELFLDGFVLRRDNAYRRPWLVELERLGL